MELRRDDDVVIERPQGGIAEALVILGDLAARQADRNEGDVVGLERLGRLVGGTGPSDPDPVGPPHYRLDSADQSARTRLPQHTVRRVRTVQR
jgi:hypothetical protein